MPTYVYRCLECDKQFEEQASFSDPPRTVCNCEKAAPVKKVFTPVGVTFRGSGFYKTDSKSSSSASRTTTSDTSSSDTSSSSTSSTTSSSSEGTSSGSTSSTPATGSTSGGD
ncbi:MAG: FmdB family transcriptional regulator [Actinobacteria bacterium]|nr:FmdB family transcriptional regulator [Actinomycetota bacterium]